MNLVNEINTRLQRSHRRVEKIDIGGGLSVSYYLDELAITRLPHIETGDYIFIHDSGAKTLSLWSRHNSRQVPKVIGYYDNGTRFEILKERENADKLWEFWS